MTHTGLLFNGLKNEAHVWLARPDSIGLSLEADKYVNMLSTYEKVRLNRFKSISDKQMYLSAHVLLRTTLSKYVDIQPENWMFERNKFGRPEIVSCLNRWGLRFNISHTPGLSACVITEQVDCGVDVEMVRHIEGISSIAKNYFSQSEAEELEYFSELQKLRKFLDIWTLKEAYAKAKGVGLSFPSRSVGFSVDNNDNVVASFDVPVGDSRSDWQFAIFNPDDHHKLAVAIRRTEEGKKIVINSV